MLIKVTFVADIMVGLKVRTNPPLKISIKAYILYSQRVATLPKERYKPFEKDLYIADSAYLRIGS